MAKTIQANDQMSMLFSKFMEYMQSQQQTEETVSQPTVARTVRKPGKPGANVAVAADSVTAKAAEILPHDYLLNVLSKPRTYKNDQGETVSTYYYHSKYNLVGDFLKIFPDLTGTDFVNILLAMVQEKTIAQYPTRGGYNVIRTDRKPATSSSPKAADGTIKLSPAALRALGLIQ